MVPVFDITATFADGEQVRFRRQQPDDWPSEYERAPGPDDGLLEEATYRAFQATGFDLVDAYGVDAHRFAEVGDFAECSVSREVARDAFARALVWRDSLLHSDGRVRNRAHRVLVHERRSGNGWGTPRVVRRPDRGRVAWQGLAIDEEGHIWLDVGGWVGRLGDGEELADPMHLGVAPRDLRACSRHVVAAWQDGDELLLGRGSVEEGWTEPVSIIRNSVSPTVVRVGVDRTGAAVVLWGTDRDGLWMLAGSRLDQVSDDVQNADFSMSLDGSAAIVWADSDQEIHARTWSPSSGLGPVQALGPGSGSPSVAISESGDATAVWRGPAADRRINSVAVSTLTRDGSWSKPATVDLGGPFLSYRPASKLAVAPTGHACLLFSADSNELQTAFFSLQTGWQLQTLVSPQDLGDSHRNAQEGYAAFVADDGHMLGAWVGRLDRDRCFQKHAGTDDSYAAWVATGTTRTGFGFCERVGFCANTNTWGWSQSVGHSPGRGGIYVCISPPTWIGQFGLPRRGESYMGALTDDPDLKATERQLRTDFASQLEDHPLNEENCLLSLREFEGVLGFASRMYHGTAQDPATIRVERTVQPG